MNTSLFHLINGLAGIHPALDKAMVFAASDLVAIVPLFLIFLWLPRSERDLNKRDVLFIISALVMSLVIAEGISAVYYHPRPFTVGLGKQLIQHGSDSSFPSQHAAAMFPVAFSLLFLKNYIAGIAFLLASLLVGFARVYSGVHFPFDIAGSIAVSVAATAALAALKGKLDGIYSYLIEVYYRHTPIMGN